MTKDISWHMFWNQIKTLKKCIQCQFYCACLKMLWNTIVVASCVVSDLQSRHPRSKGTCASDRGSKRGSLLRSWIDGVKERITRPCRRGGFGHLGSIFCMPPTGPFSFVLIAALVASSAWGVVDNFNKVCCYIISCGLGFVESVLIYVHVYTQCFPLGWLNMCDMIHHICACAHPLTKESGFTLPNFCKLQTHTYPKYMHIHTHSVPGGQ